MSTRTLSFVWLLLLAADMNGQQIDRKKIGDLIPRPNVDLMMGVGVNPTGTVMFFSEVSDTLGKIAALEKAQRDSGPDVDRYCQLSRLYADPAKAKQAANQAFELASQRYQKDPNNGRFSMQIAQALHAVGRDDEAGAFYRQAVRKAPQDSDCWLMLGDFLLMRANGALVGKKSARSVDLIQALNGRFPKENISQFQQITKEAVDCFDKAVAAAPRDAKPYLSRAGFTMQCRNLGLYPRNGTDGFTLAVFRQSTGEVLSDLQKAAELAPADPRTQAIAGFFELISIAGKLGDPSRVDGPAPKLPAKTAESIAAITRRLDKLMDHPDAKIAADACYTQALIGFFAKRGNNDAAEKWVRRALTLQPAHSAAWELLTILVADTPNAVTVCEDRLRLKDDGHNRLIAAVARFERNDLREAEQHLRAGVKLEPKAANLHLGLASALLKRGDDAGLAEAVFFLAEADDLLAKKRSPALMQRAVVLGACHSALVGSIPAAREALRTVPNQSPEFATAQKMLKALGD